MKNNQSKTAPKYSLEPLKRSRKKLKPGDIFVCRPTGYPYCFGRVIRTDAQCAGPAILCYIYEAWSGAKEDIPELSCQQLLVPPFLTGPSLWTQGDFETIGWHELGPDDVLPVHCFCNPVWGTYWDEVGNSLPGPVEPVARRSLRMPLGIARTVCEALQERGIWPSEHGPLVSVEDQGDSDCGDLDDEMQKPALVISLDLSDADASDEAYDIMGLEDELIAALENAGAGDLDGHDVGNNELLIYVYGPDVDRMWTVAEPIIKSWPPSKHGYAIKQYGSTAEDVRIEW